MSSESVVPANVVIIGAGIIGVSTAFYLSRMSTSTTIHLVESSPTLFASASGKAAGFLARDWFSQATSSLGKLSFDLHKELADENDGGKEWGYSHSTAFSVQDTQSLSGERGEDWLLEGQSRAVSIDPHEPVDGTLPQWLASGREPCSTNI